LALISTSPTCGARRSRALHRERHAVVRLQALVDAAHAAAAAAGEDQARDVVPVDHSDEVSCSRG
jgi:hypothetical protein